MQFVYNFCSVASYNMANAAGGESSSELNEKQFGCAELRFGAICFPGFGAPGKWFPVAFELKGM